MGYEMIIYLLISKIVLDQFTKATIFAYIFEKENLLT